MKTVEQNGVLGENDGMKRCFLTAVLLILLSVFCLYAAEIRVDLPQNRSGNMLLPVDSVLGQLSDGNSNEAVSALAQAMKEGYSFEWTQAHIAEEFRASLVRLFGDWFSENLPVSGALFSLPVVNADGTVGVNVRVGSSCMAFLLEVNLIVSMRLL